MAKCCHSYRLFLEIVTSMLCLPCAVMGLSTYNADHSLTHFFINKTKLINFCQFFLSKNYDLSPCTDYFTVFAEGTSLPTTIRDLSKKLV